MYSMVFLKNKFINLLFIFGCIGSLFLRPLEGGGPGGDYFTLRLCGLLIAVASLAVEHGS